MTVGVARSCVMMLVIREGVLMARAGVTIGSGLALAAAGRKVEGRTQGRSLQPTLRGSGQVGSPAPAPRRGKSARRCVPHGAPSSGVVRWTANHQLDSELFPASVPKRRRRRSGHRQADLVASLLTPLRGRSASRPAHCPAVHDSTHPCPRSTRSMRSAGGSAGRSQAPTVSGQARSVATLRAVIGARAKSSPEAFPSPSPPFRH
jgi:hypothetical protein